MKPDNHPYRDWLWHHHVPDGPEYKPSWWPNLIGVAFTIGLIVTFYFLLRN